MIFDHNCRIVRSQGEKGKYTIMMHEMGEGHYDAYIAPDNNSDVLTAYWYPCSTDETDYRNAAKEIIKLFEEEMTI